LKKNLIKKLANRLVFKDENFKVIKAPKDLLQIWEEMGPPAETVEVDYGSRILPEGTFYSTDEPIDLMISIWSYVEHKQIQMTPSETEWKIKFQLYDFSALSKK
jgi:hypothetical protein